MPRDRGTRRGLKATRQRRRSRPLTPELAGLLEAARGLHQAGQARDARALYAQVVAARPEHAESLHALGVIAHAEGRDAEAVERLRAAIAADPAQPHFHNNLGEVLRSSGDPRAALACYREALRIAPGAADFARNLGRALLGLERWDEAARALDEAVRRDPRHVEAWCELGLALDALGREDQAIASMRRALGIEPRHLNAINNLAIMLQRRARPSSAEVEETIGLYRRLLEAEPAHAESWNSLGVLYKQTGEVERARECFVEAVRHDPTHAQAIENLVRIRRLGPDDREEIAAIEALAVRPDLTQASRTVLHFALGKVHDDCGDGDRAFEHYRLGNDALRAECAFDPAAHSREIDATIATFDGALFERVRGIGSPSDSPIFIVGMMRSGTTLVEQILSAHPQVFAAGERDEIPEFAAGLPGRLGVEEPYPACVSRLEAPLAGALADGYLAAVSDLSGAALRVTDKLPNNYRHLGLIATLFPRATIVHCVRHPLDVCLSIYFQRFSGEHPYANDLDDLACVYRDYHRLMAHWQRVLPMPIHEVRYETLVDDQEVTSRALLEHCALAWDPRVLDYHRSERPVYTASDWQVRQPVYRNALARWRRYERQLRPLSSALADLAEA